MEPSPSLQEHTTLGKISVLLIIALPLATVAAALVVHVQNYLLFHSLVEVATVGVAFGAFLIIWNARKFIANNYFIYLGVAYLFIALLDLVHILSYEGMGVFPESDANLPTQVWVAARAMQAVTFLIAPFFLDRSLRLSWMWSAYACATVLMLAAIFGGIFPTCFQLPEGLTTFKIVAECVIIAMFVGGLYLLYRRRERFDPSIYRLVASSLVLLSFSELSFTLYATPEGIANLVGHVLKLASFYLIYRAIIEIGLRKPYNLLFHDLNQKQLDLQSAKQNLAQQVQDRTAELVAANASLHQEIVNRRLAQERLRADAEKLRNQAELLDLAHDAILVHDLEGKILFWNQGAKRIYGWDKEEAEGRSFHTLLETQFVTPPNKIQESLEKHGRWEGELTHLTRDGRQLVVASRWAVRCDDQGNPQAVLEIDNDITQRKRAEQELHRTQQFLEESIANRTEELSAANRQLQVYEKIVTNSPDLISVIDKDHVVQMANPAFLEVCNRASETVIGIRHEELLTEDDRNTMVPVIEKAFQEESCRQESWFSLPNGDRRYFDVNYYLLPSNGSAESIVIVSRDMTADKEAQEKEKRLLDMLEETPDFIATMDLQGNCEYANSAARKFLGLAPGVNFSAPDASPYPEKTQRLIKDHAVPTAVKEGIWRGECELLTRDGKRIFASQVMIVHAAEQPQQSTLSLIARDITERKKMETNMRRRTAELHAANKEMEAFSYSVSHDLRAPLRAIDGFSQALVEDCSDTLDQMGRSYLERIRHGAQRMSQLIDDLLTLSRLNRGELERNPVDLAELGQSVIKNLRQQTPERAVQFTVSSDDLEVEADKRLMKVVLENLIGNAWKFTSGSEEAYIELGKRRDSEGNPCYYVRDNGAGFDMTYADKLFKPFQRLHAYDEFAGTGIGLATVQRIIHRHGGRVWAESKPDGGATFFFNLG